MPALSAHCSPSRVEARRETRTSFCRYNMPWTLICDPAKRERTLRERGLDLLDARLVFDGEARHVFSMRKANEREIKAYRKQFEEG